MLHVAVGTRRHSLSLVVGPMPDENNHRLEDYGILDVSNDSDGNIDTDGKHQLATETCVSIHQFVRGCILHPHEPQDPCLITLQDAT